MLDAASAQHGPCRVVGVAPVGQQQIGVTTCHTGLGGGNGDGFEHIPQHRIVTGLTRRDQDRQRPAPAIDGQMDLGGQATP